MYHKYQLHRIPEYPEQSDGCLHSKEQIRTVSGMPASIFLSDATYLLILCELSPSLSESVRTEQVLEESLVSCFLHQVLLPFLLQFPGFFHRLHAY